MAGNSRSSTAADTASSSASTISPKKAALPKASEGKLRRARTSEMVIDAVKTLDERGGSSLFAIKKYIRLMYEVDTDKKDHLIKKYLKAAVASGELVQTKGKGVSGSFKLPSAKAQAAKRKEAKLVKAEAAAAKVAREKKGADKRASKTESAKPSSSTKKLASSKMMKKEFSATAKNSKNTKGALSKSPKAKTLARSPMTKPKAPKPKKVGAGAKSPRAA